MFYNLRASRRPRRRGTTAVPVGYLMPITDMFPREWMERQGRVSHGTETEVDRHFLESEEPEIVAADLRRFFGEQR